MIVVFDICDTLFYSNTTFDFIEHVLAVDHKKNEWRRLQNMRSKRHFSFWLTLLEGKITGTDEFKAKGLMLLKGYSKNALEAHAEAFIQKLFNNKKVAPTFQLLENAQKNQQEVILLSASIQPVVEALGKQLGLKNISTKLSFDKNVFTGKVKSEMKSEKLKAFNELYNKAPFEVITDNKSDFELVKAAAKRNVVVYSPSQKQFWKELNPNFIELYG